MDNVNQSTISSQQAPDQMNSSFENSNHSKIIPLIIGIVLLVFIGAGGYILEKNKPQPIVENNMATQPSPTLSPSEALAKEDDPTANWETETFQIKKETVVSGSETINLSIRLPSGWIIKTVSKTSDPNNIITNCADYIITNVGSTATLTISPICIGWTANYSQWPIDTIVVKEKEVTQPRTNATPDSIVRYFNDQKHNYIYVDGHKSDRKMQDALNVEYNPSTKNFLPINIMLSYSVSNIDSVFKITDQIVASLKAN